MTEVTHAIETCTGNLYQELAPNRSFVQAYGTVRSPSILYRFLERVSPLLRYY